MSPKKKASKKTARVRKKPGPKKGEGGRPLALIVDNAVIQKVEMMASFGLTLAQIASLLDISKTTFESYKKENADLFESYKRGKEKGALMATSTLYQKAKGGNLTALIFYLKTQCHWRENQRIEVTGADGKPLTVQVIKIGDVEVEF